MKKLLALLLAALMVLSLAACSMEGGSSEPAKTEETTAAPETTETETEQPAEETAAPAVKAIAVVPKSLDNAIFLDSQAAAEAKAKELGINLQWVGPTTSDAGQQVTVIEGLIEKQVDGILISCNDADALKDVIDRAVDAGIVVGCFDSGIQARVLLRHGQLRCRQAGCGRNDEDPARRRQGRDPDRRPRRSQPRRAYPRLQRDRGRLQH